MYQSILYQNAKITDHCLAQRAHHFRHLLDPHPLIRIAVKTLVLHNQLNFRARSHIYHSSKSA